MSGTIVNKINAMQSRMVTNAASRKRAFQTPAPKREDKPVDAPQTPPADASDESPSDTPSLAAGAAEE